MKFLITGDTHREFSRFKNYPEEWNTEEYGVIILGDAGINYTHDISDAQIKNFLEKKYKFYLYIVKGNHENRPDTVEGMKLIYDENVNGDVWIEDNHPRIRYFKEYGEYTINGLHTYVIGGAYSVDKEWRLMRGGGWFANEQLTYNEKVAAGKEMAHKHWDLVLSHTCPYSWRPIDLFLNCIDQSKVDNSMELWLDTIRQSMDIDVWLFGHYHADRLVRPGVEMYYHDTDYLDTIINRWKYFRTNNKLEEKYYLMPKDPDFYLQEERLDD